MPANERLLGFDIRQDASEYVDSFWDDANRQIYLIRPNTEWPLSVDTMIWPSVFRYSSIVSSPKEDERIPVNTQVAANGLWFDLELMKSWFKEHTSGTERRGVPIAIHLFAEATITMEEFGSDVIDRKVRPSAPIAGSALLGFDVADSGRVSGLADCGYSSDDMGVLRPQWLPYLNEFGLLTSYANSLEFKELSDSRVPEHAPFYIYSLYRLP